MPLPLTALQTHMATTVTANVVVAFAVGTIVALDLGDQQCILLLHWLPVIALNAA